MLERDVMVEGGEVKGRMEVNVRDWNKKEGDVYVAGGKVRVVGFEGEYRCCLGQPVDWESQEDAAADRLSRLCVAR